MAGTTATAALRMIDPVAATCECASFERRELRDEALVI
jgi:hypothetical protein